MKGNQCIIFALIVYFEIEKIALASLDMHFRKIDNTIILILKEFSVFMVSLKENGRCQRTIVSGFE